MIARRRKYLKLGLLPRMDAYRLKDGGYSFRFKTYDGQYIPLGRDLLKAKRMVLDLLQGTREPNTITALAAEYFQSSLFKRLAERTQRDYLEHSKEVLRVFGQMTPAAIEPPHIAKYLRVERANAPVRANREVALLSSILQFGIECGHLKANPCRQVRRNPERPRSRKVERRELDAIIAIAKAKGESSELIGLIAEFCALTGQRRGDLLRLRLAQIGPDGIRIRPAKTKHDEVQVDILIEWSDRLRQVVEWAKALPRPVRGLYLFCNRHGQPYTDAGFKAMWNRLQVAYAKAGGERFTFHDLRAFYVTEGKDKGLPVTEATGHKSEATANRIYDRRKIRKAKPLE